jgi:hypothetical protein
MKTVKVTGTMAVVLRQTPDEMQKMMPVFPVGDKPGHAFAIAQVKGTWSTPMVIEGIQTRSEVSTVFIEMDGGNFRNQGCDVATMENGDLMYITWQGTGTLGQNHLPENERGKWQITGGTGKLAGVSGEGTYKSHLSADNSGVNDFEGAYTIAG